MAKDKDYRRLIHTAQWVRLRRTKLTAFPLCERCREEGRLAPATEVHHIRPVEEGLTLREKEQLMFDPHNLRALCHERHVKTHTEMGRCGKKQAKERAEAHLLRFKDRFMGQ